MSRSRLAALAVGLAVLAVPRPTPCDDLPTPPTPPTPGTFRLATKSGGSDREAHIRVPRGYAPGKPPPLVVGLHGGGGDALRFLTDNGWADLADEMGFVAVAPAGLPAAPRLPANFLANPRVWNSGQLPATSPRTKIDDVAYLADLLDVLKDRVPYDPKRVFLTGHSNGGGMAFRAAEELAGRVAGLATVAGALTADAPKLDRPVPTLYVIGTVDPLMPLAGGESKTPWGSRTTKPVADSLRAWAVANGAGPDPTTAADAGGVKTVEYRPPAGGAPRVTVVYVGGHGHAWPGGKVGGVTGRMMGPVTDKLDATRRIWAFFAAIPPG